MLWKNDLVEASAGMARRLRETCLDERKACVVPGPRVQMERNALGEIDHDADNGTVVGRCHDDRVHGLDLGRVDGGRDSESAQSRGYAFWKGLGK